MSVKRPLHLHRRQVIRGLLATTAFGISSKLWTGCTPNTPLATTNSPSPTDSSGKGTTKQIVMGFIYVGSKDDFGYNQAHAQGKENVAKLPWIKTVEQANVPETTEVQEAMRNMIEQDGVNVLFPTSFGYFDPHILKVAQEYPQVQFFHCGGLYQAGKHPQNVGSYFSYIDEAQYIAGIIAAHTTKTGKLGFVGAKAIPLLLRNINSFTLGARTVNPKITTQLILTGDWSLPVKEAEAANSMIDQGVDVLTCHVDSPKVIMETAEKRGVFCSGFHANQAQLAPKGYLTGAEWNWASIYAKYAEWIRDGKTLMNGGIPHFVGGALKEGFCKLSDYGLAVNEAAKKDAEAAKAKFMDGSMVIYQGEIKDNTAKVVIPKGKEYKQQNPELEKINWLVEGVIGNTRS